MNKLILRQILDEFRITQRDFAQLIHMDATLFSRLVSPRTTLAREITPRYARQIRGGIVELRDRLTKDTLYPAKAINPERIDALVSLLYHPDENIDEERKNILT